MTDAPKDDARSSVTDHLRRLAREIDTFAYNATEEQKEALLRLLRDAQILEVLESWGHTDRRQAPRKPCSLTVHYAIEDQVLTEIIKNISPGGAFIETFAPLRVGQEVTMTIWPFNEELPIESGGEIVWTGSKGVGVKFTSPPSKQLKALIESL